jgi:hypothetical protein
MVRVRTRWDDCRERMYRVVIHDRTDPSSSLTPSDPDSESEDEGTALRGRTGRGEGTRHNNNNSKKVSVGCSVSSLECKPASFRTDWTVERHTAVAEDVIVICETD